MTLLIAIVAAWSGTSPQLVSSNLKWEVDYRQARQIGIKQQKPLAVFVGSGAEGWKHLVREGDLNADVRRALLEQFVPVYIDAETDSGRKLAEAMELGGKQGLIISDRSGQVMAFHHDGDLELADLAKHLNRYGSPDHIVITTETNLVPMSAYAAQAAPAGGYVNPFACQT